MSDFKKEKFAEALSEAKSIDSECTCHINPPCQWCIKVSDIAEQAGVDYFNLIEELKK